MSILENITALFSPDSRLALSITKIQGDASSRQYFRVQVPDGTKIACYDPAFENSAPDSYSFLTIHALFSEHGIAVPAVEALDRAHGLLLLEDCGEMLLQNVFDAPSHPPVQELYREVIDSLIRIQSIHAERGRLPFSISFDTEKLMFEFDFFIRHALLDYFRGIIRPSSVELLRREFEAITALLVKPRHFVLNHRDFHSRNILLHHDKPVIIDFQDARMGLPQYDAVSLLRDSYLQLEPSLSEELKRYHYEALSLRRLTTMSFDEYQFYFDISAFQRNIKAVGTFAYQTSVRKNTTFEHSIAPTLRYLPEYIASRSELREAGKLLQPLLDGAVR